MEDDSELRDLKRKLAIMKQLPHPESKEEMIDFLMRRLQAAEEAIGTCDQIITKERNYRKQVSQTLKAKNKEIRDVIDQEKRVITEKISSSLSSTLEMAVQDRLQTQKKLNQVENEIKVRTKEISDLQSMNQKVTQEKQQALKELSDARQQL